MELPAISEILAMGSNTLKVFYYLLDQYKTTGVISRPELVYICDKTGVWIEQIRGYSERLNDLLDDTGNVQKNAGEAFTETYEQLKIICGQVEGFGDRLKGLCYLRTNRTTPMQEIEQLFNE